MAVGPFAAATPPVTTPVPFVETFPGFTGACAFPITVGFDTHQTQRDWVDASGEVIRSHVTGSGTVTITNDTTGESVTVGASGPTLARPAVARAHGKGGSMGSGHWVLIGSEEQAEFLPFPPGAWLYTGRIADLDAADYTGVFHGKVTDLCAALAPR